MDSVNNIQLFREARGWSRPKLAELMETSPQQIERLEKGQRTLRQEWIDRAARAFEVTPAEIISPSNDDMEVVGRKVASSSPKAPDLPVVTSADAGETVEIAALDLSFPMGPGATVDDYIEEERLQFDLGYVRSFTRTPAHRLRIARGVGESMFPTLLSNDLVWIDSTQNTLNQQDRIWAVSIHGAAAIKRLRALGKGRVLVISDNSNVDNYEVEADDLRIGGRVIRFSRDV